MAKMTITIKEKGKRIYISFQIVYGLKIFMNYFLGFNRVLASRHGHPRRHQRRFGDVCRRLEFIYAVVNENRARYDGLLLRLLPLRPRLRLRLRAKDFGSRRAISRPGPSDEENGNTPGASRGVWTRNTTCSNPEGPVCERTPPRAPTWIGTVDVPEFIQRRTIVPSSARVHVFHKRNTR